MSQVVRSSIEGVLVTLRNIGWRPGAILDIGVASGTPGLYSVWPDAPICLVEPSRKGLAYMQQIAAKYPNVQVFNVAASNRTGQIAGAEHEQLVNVTFGKAGANMQDAVFPAMTVDDIVAAAALEPPFLYKLDTDSHETEILQGSSATLERTDLCILEACVFHGLRGRTRPDELWRAVHDRGFVFFDVAGSGYGTSGVMRSTDLVFVREASDLYRLAKANSAKRADVAEKRAQQYKAALRDNPNI